MGKIADATFEGASGAKYSFGVYTTDTDFKDVGAVYALTKRTKDSQGRGTHEFLYVGETGELGRRLENHEKWPCAKGGGVNAICVHTDSSGKSRLRKEADLRKANDPPCNEQ